VRILVEILHPAHVHFFRHAIAVWLERGDDVLILSREKDVANDLLREFGLPFESISELPNSKVGLLFEMAQRDLKMWIRALRFKPDVLVGIMGVTIAQVGRLIGKPAVVFYDTENAKLTNRVVYPLAHSVCTPQCYRARVNGIHVRYPSYHELAYLHPERFTPDASALARSGIDGDSTYFVLRFVSWQASHDLGEVGLTFEFKRRLVEALELRGQVVISSEGELPPDLESRRFTGNVNDIHHLLAFATAVVGESATMASEAAVLGTPAFYIAETGRGYTDEQEARYGLTHNFLCDEVERAMSEVLALADNPDAKALYASRRAAMLRERVDATTWMLDYIDSVVD